MSEWRAQVLEDSSDPADAAAADAPAAGAAPGEPPPSKPPAAKDSLVQPSSLPHTWGHRP